MTYRDLLSSALERYLTRVSKRLGRVPTDLSVVAWSSSSAFASRALL